MDGIHDLGGKFGFGRVDPAEEPVGFAEIWHARAFAVAMGCEGRAYQNADQFRHAIERIDPAGYLTHSYYGRWLDGIETLLVESGVLSREEIEARVASLGGDPAASAARPDPAADRVDYLPSDPHPSRTLDAPPRFALGARVVTRGVPSAGHTRLPAYVRGKRGRVVALHGGWVLPDSNAHGRGERPEHVYTVAFDAAELWGEAGEDATSLRIDLFESYLSAEASA